MALKTVINVCEKWLHFFPLILAALIGTALRQPDLLQLPAVSPRLLLAAVSFFSGLAIRADAAVASFRKPAKIFISAFLAVAVYPAVTALSLRLYPTENEDHRLGLALLAASPAGVATATALTAYGGGAAGLAFMSGMFAFYGGGRSLARVTTAVLGKPAAAKLDAAGFFQLDIHLLQTVVIPTMLGAFFALIANNVWVTQQKDKAAAAAKAAKKEGEGDKAAAEKKPAVPAESPVLALLGALGPALATLAMMYFVETQIKGDAAAVLKASASGLFLRTVKIVIFAMGGGHFLSSMIGANEKEAVALSTLTASRNTVLTLALATRFFADKPAVMAPAIVAVAVQHAIGALMANHWRREAMNAGAPKAKPAVAAPAAAGKASAAKTAAKQEAGSSSKSPKKTRGKKA